MLEVSKETEWVSDVPITRHMHTQAEFNRRGVSPKLMGQ